MKIIVDGNLIDTEYIYNITETGTAQYNSHVTEYNGKCVFTGQSISLHYLFRINILNKKYIDIELFECHKNLKSGDVDYSWYKDIKKTGYNKINELRDKVVGVWLENQNEIPKFDF